MCRCSAQLLVPRRPCSDALPLCEQGKDDLRQDAVMQQVFGMCSMLLQRNTDTRKRKLNIRRYKVLQVGVGCGRRPGLLILSLSPGGALLSEERCVGVVLWDGAYWPVPGGPREGSPQALQTAGLDQPEVPQEDDGALAARPASWGAAAAC